MTRPTPVQRTDDLDGPFSWVDHGGPQDAPVVVAVHGLGGSHANWHDLAPLLTQEHRVLAVDLAGHGRTPRAGRSASVRANCQLLGRFVKDADKDIQRELKERGKWDEDVQDKEHEKYQRVQVVHAGPETEATELGTGGQQMVSAWLRDKL